MKNELVSFSASVHREKSICWPTDSEWSMTINSFFSHSLLFVRVYTSMNFFLSQLDEIQEAGMFFFFSSSSWSCLTRAMADHFLNFRHLHRPVTIRFFVSRFCSQITSNYFFNVQRIFIRLTRPSSVYFCSSRSLEMTRRTTQAKDISFLFSLNIVKEIQKQIIVLDRF